MTAELINDYDFSEDALGLGDFITNVMAGLPDDEILVQVEDGAGRAAEKARFVRYTNHDGSTAVFLEIDFRPA